MIEVEQTVLGHDAGNCFEACLASLLECDISEVPRQAHGVTDMSTYVSGAVNEWLAARGLTLWIVDVVPDPVPLSNVYMPPVNCIAGVRTRVEECNHALIVRDGRVVWDPSPARTNPVGLLGGQDPVVEYVFMLLPLNPQRCS